MSFARFLFKSAPMLALMAWTGAAWALAPTTKVSSFSSHKVEERFRAAGRLVAHFLEEQHYASRKIELDDKAFAGDWMNALVELIDYNRLYFIAEDIEEFKQAHVPAMLSLLRNSGDLSPVFQIYERFEDRMADRTAWIEKRLEKPFDFTVDEYYTPNRSKADWPQNMEEADRVWELKIKHDHLTNLLTDMKAEESIKKLLEHHHRILKNIHEFEDEEIVQIYLSALAGLFDPHSMYLDPSTLQDFAIMMQLSLVGIGAVLTTEDGYCTIKEIVPGGPADLDKRLKANDRIVGVAQGDDGEYEDIVDMRLRHAVRLIRGDKGTVVRLKVIPSGDDLTARKDIRLVRDKVQIASSKAKAKVITRAGPDGKPHCLGIIDLSSFYGDMGEEPFVSDDGASGIADTPSTTGDVAALLHKAATKGIEGLVLDLRNNGGGLLSEAVRLSGLFIDKGPVVQIKDAYGRVHVLSDTDNGLAYDGPLVVLTNKFSASASEIVAGTLQNYGRALIVGDRTTHGKGTVQTVRAIGDFLVRGSNTPMEAGAIKFTIQKYYLPNGHSTQQRGVIPHIVLPSPNDYLEVGEAELPHALPWDEIQSSRFTAVDFVDKPLISKLTERSHSRVRGSEDFQLLNQEIERLKKRLEDGRVSLNEKIRKAEKVENEERRKAQEIAFERLTDKPLEAVGFFFDAANSIKEEKLVLEKKPGDKLDSGNGKRTMDSEEISTFEIDPNNEAEMLAADIQLLETLNILNDYIYIRENSQLPVELADVAASAPPPEAASNQRQKAFGIP